MVLFFPLVALISAIVLIWIKKDEVIKEDDENSKEKKINLKNDNLLKSLLARSLILLHIIIVILINLGTSFETTVLIWVLVLLNICVIALCFTTILKNKKIITLLIVLYFIIMMVIPAFKFENHSHYYNLAKLITNQNGNIVPYEEIREYIEYYNCYGIKLYRKNK